MKKFVLAIVMCVWGMVTAVAQTSTEDCVKKENPQVEKLLSRLVKGIEIDPICDVYVGDRFYRIPELGVQMIWDSQLKMLYVLEFNYYRGTQIWLNQAADYKSIPMASVLDVFKMGNLGRSELCLGKIVESGEEYWLSVAIYENEMQLKLYENMSGDVIFKESLEC